LAEELNFVYILSGDISLVEAIDKKVRRTTETSEFFVLVHALSHGG